MYCVKKLQSIDASFLGAFEKLRMSISSLFLCVSLSVRNNSAPTGRIFTKFDIWVFFENRAAKIQVSLKPDKNNGCF